MADIAMPASATNVRCNVTFPSPGMYTFTLTVTDSSGTTVTSPLTVYVPRITAVPALPSTRTMCYLDYQCQLTFAWVFLPLAVGAWVNSTQVPTLPIPGQLGVGLMFAGKPVLNSGLKAPNLQFQYSNVNNAIGQATVTATWTVPTTLTPSSAYSPFVRVTGTGKDPLTLLSITAFNIALAGSPMTISATYGYVTGAWSSCSASCDTGVHTRSVKCYDLVSNRPAVDSLCANDNNVYASLPASSQPCFVKPCKAYGWSIGAWSSCSATCGGGLQTRTVSCISAANAIVSDNLCPQPAPVSSQQCGLGACDTYAWTTSGWGACIDARTDYQPDVGVCGTGYQQRAVICINTRTAGEVDPALCASQPQPANSRTCPLQGNGPLAWPCTLPRVLWVGPWYPCSESCGGGNRTQDVYCMDTLSGRPVSNGECVNYPGYVITLPTGIGRCNLQACPAKTYSWAMGAWSVCQQMSSAPSGTQFNCGGRKTRSVSCVDSQGNAVSDSRCIASGITTKPPISVPCGSCNLCSPLYSGAPTCSGHGKCNTDKTCRCDSGWSGPVCNVMANCTALGGVVDNNGGCCTTILNKDGACCVGSSARLDKFGQCCPTGILDVCGVCNGNGTAMDVAGQCCSGQLDARRLCCPADVGVDVCGVCGGNNVCGIEVAMDLTVSNAYTQADMTVRGCLCTTVN